MSKKLSTPMEHGTNPYIKCGTDGVICQNLKDFILFCQRLFGEKDPHEYSDLKKFVEGRCKDFGGDDLVFAVISHVALMAYLKATKKGGWETKKNHRAYLMTIAKNEIKRVCMDRMKHNHNELDGREWIPMAGNAYERSEMVEIIRKAIKKLRRSYPADALIIDAMYLGYDKDNDALAEYVGRKNDEAFRTAKTRAKTRMRLILLEMLGRGPDGPGSGPGNVKLNSSNYYRNINESLRSTRIIEIDYEFIECKYEKLSKCFSLKPDTRKYERNNKSYIHDENTSGSSIYGLNISHERCIGFMKSIFEEISNGDFERLLKGHGFRKNLEWLKDAA